MKLILNLLALAPISMVCATTTSTTSTSINYVDRKDSIGSCKALLVGLHFNAEEENGLGSQTDVLFAGDRNFHIVYTNTELYMRYAVAPSINVCPTISWKNIWRGVNEKKESSYDAFSVSSISSQHGTGYLGARVEYPYNDYLSAYIHPQLFYEAVAVCFVNNHAKFRGTHSQRSRGWALTLGLTGKIKGHFSYSLQQKAERSFNGASRDFISSLNITYGF